MARHSRNSWLYGILVFAVLAFHGEDSIARSRNMSVCSLFMNNNHTDFEKNAPFRDIVNIRARIEQTYHFGLILVDDACNNRFIRIINPVPDPNQLGSKFQTFREKYGKYPDLQFLCNCFGKIEYIGSVTLLALTDATVTEVKRALPAHENSALGPKPLK